MEDNFVYTLIELLASESNLFFNFLKLRTRKSFSEFWNAKEERLQLEIKYQLSFDFGVTKAVFIPNGKDYVIKIPFSKLREDFCKIEYNNYLAARENEVGDFFGWCEKLPLHNIYIYEDEQTKVIKIPIYLMEKVILDEKLYEEVIRDSLFLEEFSLFSEEVNELMFFLRFKGSYNLKDLINLANFLDDFLITDFHGKNIGFNKFGRPVLIDYSGY